MGTYHEAVVPYEISTTNELNWIPDIRDKLTDSALDKNFLVIVIGMVPT